MIRGLCRLLCGVLLLRVTLLGLLLEGLLCGLLGLAHGEIGRRLVFDHVFEQFRRVHAGLRLAETGERGRETVARPHFCGLPQPGVVQRLKPCAALEAEALDVHGAPAVIVLHHRIGDAGVDGDEHLHLRLSVIEELRLAGLEIADLVGGHVLDDSADRCAGLFEFRALAALRFDAGKHLLRGHGHGRACRRLTIPLLIPLLGVTLLRVTILLLWLSEHDCFPFVIR